MILAGLQKQSLIDFTGKVSCVLFTSGCNFHCPYCHNPDLARGLYPQRISIAALADFLGPRSALLDGAVITGGEPTLHAGLEGLCHTVARFGLAVKLDTNGSRPDTLQRLIDLGCIDSIAMDLKTDPDGYGPPLCREPMADAVRKSIGIIMKSGLDYEFRTTCVRPFVDETRILKMAGAIEGAKRYILQRCNTDVMLEQGYFDPAASVVDDEQMATLQTIASPLVADCSIR